MSSQVLPSNDDEEMYSSVPPGYKFTPTDEGLIESFLCKKICGQPVPWPDKIPVLDVYNTPNLEEVIETYKAYGEKKNEWFFFSPRKLKQEKGNRRERITPDGQWKISSRAEIHRGDSLLIGEKRTLKYVRKGSKKAKFIMDEYTVSESFLEKIKIGLGNSVNETSSWTAMEDMTFDEWVVCKIHESRCNKASSSGKENYGRKPETSRKRKEPPLSVETHNDMADSQADYMYQGNSVRAQHEEQQTLTVDNVLGNHNSPNNTQESSIYDCGIDQSMDLCNYNNEQLEQRNSTRQVLNEEHGDMHSWLMEIWDILDEEENLVTPQQHSAVTVDNIHGNQTLCHYQLEVAAGGNHHNVLRPDISYLHERHEQVNLSIPQYEKYQLTGNDVPGNHNSCHNNQQELVADHDHHPYVDPNNYCYSPLFDDQISIRDLMTRMSMGVDLF